MSQIVHCNLVPSASLKSGISQYLNSVFRRDPVFLIIELVVRARHRILIVDHNTLLLEGLRTLIGLQPEMELVGVAASASQAVELFRRHRPKVVLMDLDLPKSAGIHSIREIHEIDRMVCILGLFTHPGDESAGLALRAGARKCITKDLLNRDLVTLIHECLRAGA